MAYQALYRKWRPLTFSDVAGQSHVSETLKHAVGSGRIAHAYLFCGTRGTGKTSTAKIFSRAVNCERPVDGEPCNECDTCRGILDGTIMDVYEMDAASNSGVDNIRGIRDDAAFMPSGCKYKVFIIDEAHMLSKGAFNALLKTLEEPPPHVIFILATTEAYKIPATILSRCQRYDFRPISDDDITKRLKYICEREGIDATADALEIVARHGNGSMRDALSILDQCVASASGKLTSKEVEDIIGAAGSGDLFALSDCVASKNAAGLLEELDALGGSGKDPMVVFEDIIKHFRNLLICASCAGGSGSGDSVKSAVRDILSVSKADAERYMSESEKFKSGELIGYIETLSGAYASAKSMDDPKTGIELGLIKILTAPEEASLEQRLEDIEKRLTKLEEAAALGKFAKAPDGGKRAGDADAVNPAGIPNLSAGGSSNAREVSERRQSSGKKGETWDKWPIVLKSIMDESKKLYMLLYNAKARYFGDYVEIEVSGAMAYNTVSKREGLDYMSAKFEETTGERLPCQIVYGGMESDNRKKAGSDKESVAGIVKRLEELGADIEVD